MKKKSTDGPNRKQLSRKQLTINLKLHFKLNIPIFTLHYIILNILIRRDVVPNYIEMKYPIACSF